jgi:hypothetical protein
MRAIKLVLYLALAVVLAWVFIANPGRTEVQLPGLPMLEGRTGFFLVLAFLVGLLPSMLSHRVSRFLWRRKLAKTEAKVATTAVVPAAAVPSINAPETEEALLARARAAGGAAGYSQ